jgi:hypothetical protein
LSEKNNVVPVGLEELLTDWHDKVLSSALTYEQYSARIFELLEYTANKDLLISAYFDPVNQEYFYSLGIKPS